MHKCPRCGRYYCECTPQQRRETPEEMQMTDEQLSRKRKEEQGGRGGCM